MSDDKIKVLVLNPLPNQLEKAVKITNMQNKKAGPFEFSLFLGDVLPASTTNDITLATPDIPIYFSEGENEVQEELKLPDNFFYLGKIGTYKLTNGLKVGFVHGHLDNISSEEIEKCFDGQNVDILLTYFWPDAIAKEEKLVLSGHNKLDALILSVKPRYWFACGGPKGRYFERDAYSVDGRVTRFISLATMNEGRWWYAFQIGLDPISDSNVKTGKAPIIESGLFANNKRVFSDDDLKNKEIKRLKNTATSNKQSVTPASCFLCLSNPKFELHMIISIANLSFVTVSKGPLTLKTDFGFSGHGIIVPIEHHPTLREYVQSKNVSAKVEESEIVTEITKLQESLVAMFRSLGDYSVCFWEISRKRSIHCHLQFVPVHNNIIPYFEKTLKSQIEYDKRFYPEPLRYTKFCKNDDMKDFYETINSQDYVLFTVYEKLGFTRYLIKLGNDEDKYFDAQFPRKVLAVMLNLKNRIHWNKCAETHEEESLQKQKFQDAYRPFDIMLATDASNDGGNLPV